MGEKMHWTNEKLNRAREILTHHRKMDRALAEIYMDFGEAFTLDAMRRAFYRNGLDAPRIYLGMKRKPVAISDMPKTHTANGATSIKYSSIKPAVLYHNKTTRILIVSDLHAPFHDKDAWECLLEVVRQTNPGTIVIIGDFSDCLAISSHPKSLDRKHDFAKEVEGVNRCLDELRDAAGYTCRIVWTAGNHEDRITRYLQSNAPELGGIKELRAEGLFRCSERRIEWIPYRDSIKIGNCSFTHDVGRCGVNTARQSLLDWGGNIVVGHSHRGGVAYQGEAKGSSHFCLNVGWLGDVNEIDYNHKMRCKRDWQLGFGIVDQNEDGFSWASFIPVLNGSCVVDGQLIEGKRDRMMEAA